MVICVEEMLKWKRVCHTFEAFYFCQNGIFFFAAYKSAIFNALLKLDEHNYEHYSQMSSCQYKKVKERQQNDLDNLVAKILKL